MRRVCCPVLVGWLCLLAPAPAAPPDHPVVPGFERFYTADKADAAVGGRLLLTELGCVACHEAGAPSAQRQGPVLDGVAARVRPSFLRRFLRDPQSAKPGTTMPALFAADADRDQKVEALVHYLASAGTPRPARPDRRRIAAGRDLYLKVGCVACHGNRDVDGNADKVLPTSVPLADLKARYTLAGLTSLLENPHAVRPSGRMPKLLNSKEAGDVANYLLQGLNVDFAAGRGAVGYAYYEGSWQKLPDFDRLKPVATGKSAGLDVGVARRDGNYGLRFEGVFKLDREGTCKFDLGSDDGSRLYVDGKVVVDNDGHHGTEWVSGRVRLPAGVHKVVVVYFQAGGGAELDAYIEASSLGGRHRLGDLLAVSEEALTEKPPARTDEDALEVRPDLVEKGRALFASAGCASCHTMQERGKPVASSLKAPALKPEGGCLAPAAVKGRPHYALTQRQRKALTAAVRTPPAPAKAPAEVIAQTMLSLNCYACHVRDKVGGPEEELDKSFQTTQPEMGDEGRLPPPLDGIGAKITADYLKTLLDRGTDDRPYMHTRMPGFGPAAAPLAQAFKTADKLPKVPAVTFKEPTTKIKSTARHLVGGQAFGCIKCHTFNGHKAEGVQGIDMTLMPKRLERDWFHAYIAEPQRVRPGTRMPAAFVEGKSVLPDVLDGTAATQIEAMWVYLSEGGAARLPVGMRKESIPLVPATGAIVYRNFIEGAGTRAIGVGYPEKVNSAFDANEGRLALLWQGGFIDAARHWTGRGDGVEGPLGDNVLRFPAGLPFATLSRPDEAWPAGKAKERGYRFLGYRLTPDDRPTFLYAVGDVKVEDFGGGVPGKEGVFRRRLTLSASRPAPGLHFRPVVADKIEAAAGGVFRLDGWKLKVEGAVPRLRQSGGKTELLVPLRFDGGKAEVTLEYLWE